MSLEIDVLIASAKWLFLKRKVFPYRFSPTGNIKKELSRDDARKRLINEVGLEKLVEIEALQFRGTGADIVGVDLQSFLKSLNGEAHTGVEWWQIECKAAGSGTKQTQLNQFQRALASVVGFFGESPPEEFKAARPYLGLALSATPYFLRHLKGRVRKPLRKALNLWVLLYDSSDRSMRVVSPEDDY